MVKWLKHLACSVRNERKLLELIQIFLQIVIYKLILQIMHFRVFFSCTKSFIRLKDSYGI